MTDTREHKVSALDTINNIKEAILNEIWNNKRSWALRVFKLVPLGDRVVLKQLVAEETTKSGIVLPGQSKEKPQQAEVVAVGPGGVVDGKEVTMQVKVGDQVIYSKYAGTDVKIDEEEYIIVKQSDILAVIQ